MVTSFQIVSDLAIAVLSYDTHRKVAGSRPDEVN
jgi:hypothetical protein